MKRNIILLLFFIGAGPTRLTAQQLTVSSLYDLQGLLHNAATTGVSKHGIIGGSFRTMWSGIDGGPQTTTVFGSGYLSKINLGIGGYLYNDVTGPTKRMGLQMAYAYHIPLRNTGSFSLGIEARLQQFSFDKGKLQQSLGNDPVLGTTDNRFKGDAGFGLAYTSKKLQLGAAVSQLIQSKLDFYTGNLNRTEQGKLYRHYYLHSDYIWDVDETSKIIPNILFVYLPNAPLEVQGGVRVEHKGMFFWGISLRARQSWMISMGVHINKKFTIGYSFDFYETPLSVFDKGWQGHEILLKYEFLK